MVTASKYSPSDSRSYLQDILNTPEHPELRRLATVVEHLFEVPVAYMALLGYADEVVARIGSGTEYAPYLAKLQLGKSIDEPRLLTDLAGYLPEGTDLGGLRFAASAPLRSSSGIRLGVLVIADLAPRPNFSSREVRTLADLASVLAGKMELRAIASMALDSELSLRETERRFRGIANCAPVLLMYCGADGGCLFVNRTWLEFSGRKLEEELESGWADLIHPDYREHVREGYWRAFEKRVSFATEAPFRRHDGQYRWVLGQGAPRFRDDGSFAGYVGCLLDITDYHQSLVALRKQSQFAAAVAEAARVSYLVLDCEGRIEEIGPLCRNRPHGESQEMVGRSLWEACDEAAPAEAAIRAALDEAVAGRAAVQVPGEERTWTFTPIEGERGEISAIVATVFEPPESGRTCRCACGRLCPPMPGSL